MGKIVISPVKHGKLLGKRTYSGKNCCVPLCFNAYGKDKVTKTARSYYRIPKSSKTRKLWLTAIPREKWEPTDSTVICSDHFKGGKKTNAPGSEGYVPSIFPTKCPPKPRQTVNSKKCDDTYDFQILSNISKVRKRKTKVIPTKRGRPTKPLTPAQDTTVYPNAVWLSDNIHDYVKTQKLEKVQSCEVNTDILTYCKALEEENEELKASNTYLLARTISLQTITDEDFQLWTNLPNRAVFNAIAGYLKTRGASRLKYWRGDSTNSKHYTEVGRSSKPGPARTLTFDNELFLVLVKLKTGMSSSHLENLFQISATTIGNIFTTIITFLASELKLLFQMQQMSNEFNNPCFNKWPKLFTVIDCTEIQIQTASDLQSRKELYSNYKKRETVKFLVGMHPSLAVNYVSKAWGGRASDKKITLEAENFLDAIPSGSAVMTDRGFDLDQEFKERGIHLIIPDFKGRGRLQMTKEECRNSETIAKARIHIERIMQRIKTFHILDGVLPLTMKDIVEHIVTVCAYLVNFQMPIVKTN